MCEIEMSALQLEHLIEGRKVEALAGESSMVVCFACHCLQPMHLAVNVVQLHAGVPCLLLVLLTDSEGSSCNSSRRCFGVGKM